MTQEASAPTAQTSGGMSSLLENDAFRGVAIANVLSAVAYGSSRFVFVWLVGDLTDWDTAIAILGILIGLPPLLLSAWAGSLADRLAPRTFGLTLFGLSAVLFGVTAALVSADVMTVRLAMVFGFITAIAPSMLVPVLQALVPSLVPPNRLMQAVAVQNLGGVASTIFGTFLGGAVIQFLGIGAGFWLLTIASLIGTVQYARTPLPDQLDGDRVGRHGALREGARIALGTEPLRSMLILTAVFGIAIATTSLLLPEFARDVLDNESLAASGLMVAMSLGMITTSMVLATRWSPRRPGLVVTIITTIALGGGLIAIGSSRVYWLTVAICAVWGSCGGIAMTLLRTLTQVHTPPELMGRVMGLAAMAQNGAFPVGALLLVVLVNATSVSTAMILAGVTCTVGCGLVAIRPHIRSL